MLPALDPAPLRIDLALGQGVASVAAPLAYGIEVVATPHRRDAMAGYLDALGVARLDLVTPAEAQVFPRHQAAPPSRLVSHPSSFPASTSSRYTCRPGTGRRS